MTQKRKSKIFSEYFEKFKNGKNNIEKSIFRNIPLKTLTKGRKMCGKMSVINSKVGIGVDQAIANYAWYWVLTLPFTIDIMFICSLRLKSKTSKCVDYYT